MSGDAAKRPQTDRGEAPERPRLTVLEVLQQRDAFLRRFVLAEAIGEPRSRQPLDPRKPPYLRDR